MKNLYKELLKKGTVKTNYFNGDKWIDNTRKFMDYLKLKGLEAGIDYSIENLEKPSKSKQRFVLKTLNS